MEAKSIATLHTLISQSKQYLSLLENTCDGNALPNYSEIVNSHIGVKELEKCPQRIESVVTALVYFSKKKLWSLFLVSMIFSIPGHFVII